MRSAHDLFMALINRPLYTKFALGGDGIDEVKRARYFSDRFDMYCPFCKKGSIWTPLIASELHTRERQELLARQVTPTAGSSITRRIEASVIWHESFRLSIVCERNKAHHAYYIFEVLGPTASERAVSKARGNEDTRPITVLKVGQYPSLADFQMGNIGELEEGMTEQQRKEFVQAITTGAHGFSVAACVHYRRVFESFLREARDQHISDEGLQGWPDFDTAHMEDKIKLVAGRLPEFVSQHPHLYKLLSVAVHELTEEECADELPTLRDAIELIVRDRIKDRRDEKQRQQVSKTIARAIDKHKDGRDPK